MQNVFPLRTAPSQMTACQRFCLHQVSTCLCLRENRIISFLIPVSRFPRQRRQRLKQRIRLLGFTGLQQLPQRL